jgi:hypothetical protein
MSLETGTSSVATIDDAVVERTQQSGLAVLGSGARFTNVWVLDSLPDGNGAFGDGLLASPGLLEDDVLPAPVQVEAAHIEDSARAGLLAFASEVTVRNSRFECNDIHLNGETYEGLDFSIVDEGGNVCGCDGQDAVCKVLSSDLEIPGPIN